MRKIDRSVVEYPQFLKSSKVISRLDDIKQYFKLEKEERKYRRINFTYLHDSEFFNSVRDPLSKIFGDKCAYCEVRININDLIIDLFRPKQTAGSLKTEDVSFNHYLWFAFEWHNLFLCCNRCSNAKRNIFPVSGPRAPILCTWEEACLLEANTILNPCEDKPARHLKVKLDGSLIHKSNRGHLTIKVLDLNDEILVELRKNKLERCLKTLFSLQITDERVSAINSLSSELKNDSEFSGLVNDFFVELLKSIAKKLGFPTPKGFDIQSYLSIAGSLFKRAIDLYDFASKVNNSEIRTKYAYEYSESNASITRNIRKETARSIITSIKIQKFKGIDDLEFSIAADKSIEGDRVPCLNILGENATGKYSVLQAIALCLMGSNNRNVLNVNVEEYLPRYKTGWQQKLAEFPFIEISFEDGRKSVLKINPLTKTFDGDAEQSAILLSFGARRYFDPMKAKYFKKERFESLFDLFSTSSHPRYWLASINDNTFASIARALREIFVLSEDDKVVRNSDGHIFIHAYGRETPVERLSEGYKSIFSLVMNVARAMIEQWGILEEARGVVLIDEIDIHLHPRWKIRVVKALRTAFPKVQFITTTHDPLCLRGFSKDEIRVLYRSDDYEIKSLETLPDTSSLRIEQLLTSDLFGLATTEDRSVEEYFNQLAFDKSDDDGFYSLEAMDDLKKKQGLDIPIGDTPAEQIQNEAIKRFLQQRNTLDAESREHLKEEAIIEVLSALKSKSSKLQ